MKNGELSRDFDPYDPDCRVFSKKGSSDVVSDDSDFADGGGVETAGEDRIKSLEDRLEKLEVTVEVGATFTNSSQAVIKEMLEMLREAERRIINLENDLKAIVKNSNKEGSKYVLCKNE